MADEKQLEILKRGVDAWNRWREKNYGLSIDLSGADLRDANLRGADLSGANLENTIFSSKSSLKNILVPLTEEQLASIIFEDE